jgi:hypothetical protein
METTPDLQHWCNLQIDKINSIEENTKSLLNNQVPRIQMYQQQIASMTSKELQKAVLINKANLLVESHGPQHTAHLIEHSLHVRSCPCHKKQGCPLCLQLSAYGLDPSEIDILMRLIRNQRANK